MSSKYASGAEQTLHFCSNLANQSSKNPLSANVSFSSRLTTRSRIFLKRRTGPVGTRGPVRTSAFCARPAGAAETLYQVLGIAVGGSATTSDVIKKAYKQMARKYHPDVSPPDRADEWTRRFIMVHEAYETLSNPKTRALYDRDLAAGLVFPYSTKKPHQYHHQKMEKEEWKIRWKYQLDELKQRCENSNSSGRMTWAARMRNQT